MLAAVVASLALVAPAHAATSCKSPAYPGTGSFTSLTVAGTSCTAGQKFVVAYYKCRTAHGKSGRCVKKVKGYACRETRQSGPTEIDATVTCTNGKKRIKHSYQQSL